MLLNVVLIGSTPAPPGPVAVIGSEPADLPSPSPSGDRRSTMEERHTIGHSDMMWEQQSNPRGIIRLYNITLQDSEGRKAGLSRSAKDLCPLIPWRNR